MFLKAVLSVEPSCFQSPPQQRQQTALGPAGTARSGLAEGQLEQVTVEDHGDGCVCFVLQVVLNVNISVLQEEVEQLRQAEVNLTAQLGLKEDHIDALQQNLTQASHQTESCFSLKDAAQSQMAAAQTQTRACQSNQQYLNKQLQKCKAVDSQQTSPEEHQTPDDDKSASPPLAGVPLLPLLVYIALHLMTFLSESLQKLMRNKIIVVCLGSSTRAHLQGEDEEQLAASEQANR
ncbi:hypothetical protein F2P81_005109 [Scophthalmus maximus]|uniref:Uncharacterized protein n=1 Tax=Scophthalmus maximus TaxID=52904 RepID=A0A6A4T5M9_SCOMX|nr:hypothetical protein F2P81_005109 [Scophthalmus maximus]